MQLNVQSLSITYKTHKNSLKAVDDVTFSLYRGSTLALVGESGSGKTTVAKAVAGIIPHAHGSVTIDEEKQSLNMYSPLWKKKIQMVFQDPDSVFNPKRSIDWHFNEIFSLWHPQLSLEERIAKKRKLLNAMELQEEILSRYSFELSGGQKQRASLVRSLLVDPSFLILDEPLASQDASKRKSLLTLLKKLQKEFSLGYLYITHDLSSLSSLSDFVAVMYQGSVVEQEKTQEILSRPKQEYTKKLLGAQLLNIKNELERRFTNLL